MTRRLGLSPDAAIPAKALPGDAFAIKTDHFS